MNRGLCLKVLIALAVPAVMPLTAPQARAGFDLGVGFNYAVLVEPNANNFQLNNSTVFGNVGIGNNLSKVDITLNGAQITSNGFIKPAPGQPGTGRLDIADPDGIVTNPGNVSGGVFFNQSQVTTALNTINALNATLGAEAGTALTINGGGQLVNVSAGTLDPFGNRVFSLTAASSPTITRDSRSSAVPATSWSSTSTTVRATRPWGGRSP